MPHIEEQNLTEYLQDVKLKMANITFSKDADINEISDFLNESHGKFIRSQVIYLYGRLEERGEVPLILIDAAERSVDIPVLQFPLWLAFAAGPGERLDDDDLL